MKKMIISVLVGAIFGGVGVWAATQQSNFSEKPQPSSIISVAEAKGLPETVQQNPVENKSINYQRLLNNLAKNGKRLYLDLSQYPKTDDNEEEKTCAGLTFLPDSKTALLHGAHDPLCDDKTALKLNIKWLDNRTFILIEKEQDEERNCPPRTFLYKVASVTDTKVILEEIWTGWNATPDKPNEKETYLIDERV